MGNRKWFPVYSQYKSYTKLISELINGMNINFYPMERLKSEFCMLMEHCCTLYCRNLLEGWMENK